MIFHEILRNISEVSNSDQTASDPAGRMNIGSMGCFCQEGST